MPLFSRQPRPAAPIYTPTVDDLIAELDERIFIAHQTRDADLVDELLGCRYELQTRTTGGTQ
jgi:hypothetical protein